MAKNVTKRIPRLIWKDRTDLEQFFSEKNLILYDSILESIEYAVKKNIKTIPFLELQQFNNEVIITYYLDKESFDSELNYLEKRLVTDDEFERASRVLKIRKLMESKQKINTEKSIKKTLK